MREKALSLFGVKYGKMVKIHKKSQLKDREITIEKSGSIADSAMQLSGVFQAAQEAADTYLKSIKATARHV